MQSHHSFQTSCDTKIRFLTDVDGSPQQHIYPNTSIQDPATGISHFCVVGYFTQFFEPDSSSVTVSRFLNGYRGGLEILRNQSFLIPSTSSSVLHRYHTRRISRFDYRRHVDCRHEHRGGGPRCGGRPWSRAVRRRLRNEKHAHV